MDNITKKWVNGINGRRIEEGMTHDQELQLWGSEAAKSFNYLRKKFNELKSKKNSEAMETMIAAMEVLLKYMKDNRS